LTDEANELLLIHSTTLQQQPVRRTQGTVSGPPCTYQISPFDT
jgi:hypothetical protein